MIVTTLPITPGKHNSFKTLFGPLIADIFAKLTGYQFITVLNVVHSFHSFDIFVNEYLDQLSRLNIKPSVVKSDNSQDYKECVINVVYDLFNRGFLKIQKMSMIYCDCGVVELPYVVYKTLKAQNRYKNIQQDRCKECGSKLLQKTESVLVLHLPNEKMEISISPSFYKNRLEQGFENFQRPIVISRNHRNGLRVTLKGQSFNLDTDFYWMVYLIYLNDQKVYIISGSDTINHSAKAIKLCSICKPKIQINLIAHPLLEIVNSNIELSNFNINKYLDYCKTAKEARTFLMLGAQWSKMQSIISTKDLHLVKNSVYPKQNFIFENCINTIVPEDFCKTVNRNKILELLKIMRGFQIKLNDDQAMIKDSLLG